MGRPRIPVAVKKLQGNRSGRWQDLEAGIVLTAEMPLPPASLPENVKLKFIETAELLFAIGTLTKCDVEALVRYATYSVLLSQAHLDLHKMNYVGLSKQGRVQYNPALKVIAQIVPLQSRFESDMGMSAAARSRIHVGKLSKPDVSPTQKYLT